jgi:hypothetical protein
MTSRSTTQVFQGQRVLVECEFRLAGVPTDPIVVQCTFRPPTGGQTSLNYPDPALTRTGTGLFVANVVVDEGGTWWFRFEGFGTVDAVHEIPVEVTSSVFVL